MANRTSDSQSEHDRVIEASAATWRRNQANVVHTNPNGKQNFSVNDSSFPDIVITDVNNRLLAIEEIETEDSVNQLESKQWTEYAGFGVKFNLVVPATKINEAYELIKPVGNIRIQGYSQRNGQIIFD